MYQHNKIIGQAVALLERTERRPGPQMDQGMSNAVTKTKDRVVRNV